MSHRRLRSTCAALGALVALVGVARADIDIADDKPLPGRDAVKPMRPDWCGSYKPHIRDNTDVPGDFIIKATSRSLSSLGFTDPAVGTLALAACERPDLPNVQSAVARWRQRHVNLTGLSEQRERAMLARYLRYSQFVDEHEEVYGPDRRGFCEQKAFASVSVDDEESKPRADRTAAVAALASVAGGCGPATWSDRSRGPIVADYWFDRDEAPSSEIARAAAVVECLSRGLDADGRPDPDQPEVFLAYAMCGADARRLDPAKVEAELADPLYTEWARVHVRETLARATAITEHLTAAYRGLAGKHPEVQQLAFDLPEKTWKAWTAGRATWKAEVDLALAYEDALVGTSKKARLGCSDKLHAALDRWAAAQKVTTVAAARKLAADPIGHILVEKTILCDRHDHPEEYNALPDTIAGMIDGRIFRGPRWAVFWAVTDAISTIAEDDESYPLRPGAGGPPIRPLGVGAGIDLRDDNQARGEISKVTTKGDKVVVTFKTVKATREVTECVDTGKFWGWDAQGRPVFHQKCRVTGTVTETVSPDPIAVPAVVGGKLAKGQFGRFWVSASSSDRAAAPIEIYADKSQKVLVNFRGVNLR